MRVFYSRISTVEQSVDRQLQSVNSADFDLVLIDRCSGMIPLFERAQGSQLQRLLEQNKLTHLEIHNLDRLGRDTLNILHMFRLLTDANVRIICRNPSLENFDSEGKVNPISELLLNIISALSSYEVTLIRERQAEGIAIRKMQGLYKGRRINTQESPDKFLNKKKSKQILEYLKLEYSHYEIRRIIGCSYSTIQKVKRLSQLDNSVEQEVE
jgi:DNA invertase Pin-like site-specific DNA recombinase